MKKKELWNCFYKAGYYTIFHDGIEHAGYLAFLGLLSFFPFLVFFVALAGFIGELDIGIKFVNDVTTLLPADLISALKPRIEEIISGPPQGLMTLAIIGIIWTASSAVEGMRTILNRAYRVDTPPAYLLRRFLSIAQFLILTVCIIIGMALLIFAPIVWVEVKSFLHINDEILSSYVVYFQYGISTLILFIAVAISYYILPNIRQTWRAVIPGTVVVLLLWIFAANLFTTYLQNFDQVNIVYGSLGGIIAALLFFYISAVIYIFGAEFNYFFERAMGHTIVQKEEGKKEKEND